MKKVPLFSIIIPIYNVEKYLVQCIESVLNQDYDDYELILVDDGSPDNCGEICDSYLNKNSNIRVIHKKNGGISDARNTGLKEAKGDYVIFIDSDDYICDNHFLLKLAKVIENGNFELIMYGSKKYFENKNIYEDKNLLTIEDGKTIIHNMIEQNYFKAATWDKVIKRKILVDNNIVFPFGKLSEDIEWCAKLLNIIENDKITFLNENMYVYRQREKSISKTVKEKHIIDIISIIETERLNDNNPKSFVVNSFLAYEYSVLLGLSEIIKINKNVKKRIISNRSILKYDISNKVKYVNKLIKVLGIKIASKVLGIYIKVK